MLLSAAEVYSDIIRNDLSAFIHRSFCELYPRTSFELGWYIDQIAAKLERVRRGDCKRLTINLPPRHLKSFVVSVVWPAWLLGHDSSIQIVGLSYGQELADKHARDCRTLMSSPFYQAVFPTHSRLIAIPSPISRQRRAVADWQAP